ncbi:hypothetical protein ACLOJK_020180 [Asimina triloba]
MREATNNTRKSVPSKANSTHRSFLNSFLHISSLPSTPPFLISHRTSLACFLFCFSFFLLGQSRPNSANARLMAPSRNFPYGLIALSALLLLSLTSLPSRSGAVGSAFRESADTLKQEKNVLGSRPPLCVNKCLKCSPCMATLVVPPHMKSTEAKLQEDESYYLRHYFEDYGLRFMSGPSILTFVSFHLQSGGHLMLRSDISNPLQVRKAAIQLPFLFPLFADVGYPYLSCAPRSVASLAISKTQPRPVILPPSPPILPRFLLPTTAAHALRSPSGATSRAAVAGTGVRTGGLPRT